MKKILKLITIAIIIIFILCACGENESTIPVSEKIPISEIAGNTEPTIFTQISTSHKECLTPDETEDIIIVEDETTPTATTVPTVNYTETPTLTPKDEIEPTEPITQSKPTEPIMQPGLEPEPFPTQPQNPVTDATEPKEEETVHIIYVYITPNGKKYHTSKCRYHDANEDTCLSLEEAEAQGYTACKVCH